MLGPAFAYVVAISTLALCALIALTLVNTVGRLDPPTGADRTRH